MNVGKFCVQERKKRNWTQNHLARKIGVPDNTVSRFERSGRISIVTYLKLLAAFEFIDKKKNYTSFVKKIGRTLKTERIKQGMSRNQLAIKAGLAGTVVTKGVESGTLFYFNTYDKICKALGLEPDFFFKD